MKRELLLDTLKRVEPGLSSKDFVPSMSALCFGEKSVHAYDDIIALEYPYGGDFQPPVRGGLKGRLLLDFLANSNATEATFVAGEQEATPATKGEITVKAGRSKVKLALLDPSTFVFQFPVADPDHTLSIGKEVIDKLKLAIPAMSHDPSKAEWYGVTVHFRKKGGITFYTTTGNSVATQVRVEIPTAEASRGHATIMPPRFCELLVEISGRDAPQQLILMADWVEARFASGLRLFSKTAAGANIEMFLNIFTPLKQKAAESSVMIPEGFDRALQRALTLAPYVTGDLYTDFVIDQETLHLKTVSPAGEVLDRVPLPGHASLTAKAQAAQLQKVLVGATFFQFIPDTCVILIGDAVTHLVTLIQE